MPAFRGRSDNQEDQQWSPTTDMLVSDRRSDSEEEELERLDDIEDTDAPQVAEIFLDCLSAMVFGACVLCLPALCHPIPGSDIEGGKPSGTWFGRRDIRLLLTFIVGAFAYTMLINKSKETDYRFLFIQAMLL
eukprot:CAMPEP_0172669232 /NCGR_PEP_ID=MMETSP1074-20121228/9550_1 /TAXON_ID=2916 /ORGANISM="Ceratium fusus, Strain PA161109" /LENGTH=132 /DNA_ID=CAMNT_0013485981 /DNA_START=150 /DNA_END=548 /DNA_ORIENTATION=+